MDKCSFSYSTTGQVDIDNMKSKGVLSIKSNEITFHTKQRTLIRICFNDLRDIEYVAKPIKTDAISILSKKNFCIRFSVIGKNDIIYFIASKEKIDKIIKTINSECSELARKGERNTVVEKETKKSKIKNDNLLKIDNKYRKVTENIVSNPYRILGIPCNTEKSEALNVQNKIIKLARLNAASSFTTKFELKDIEKPNREVSALQTAIAELSDYKYKWFWFITDKYCLLWKMEFLLIELQNSDINISSYDLFLACYFRQLVLDSDFNKKHDWKIVFEYLNKLLCSNKVEQSNILKARFPQSEQSSLIDDEILKSFSETVFTPCLALISGCDGKTLVSIYETISGFNKLYIYKKQIYSKMVKWLEKERQKVIDFLDRIVDDIYPTKEELEDVITLADHLDKSLSRTVYRMFEITEGKGAYSEKLIEVYDNIFRRMAAIIYAGGRTDLSAKYYNMIACFEK